MLQHLCDMNIFVIFIDGKVTDTVHATVNCYLLSYLKEMLNFSGNEEYFLHLSSLTSFSC